MPDQIEQSFNWLYELKGVSRSFPDGSSAVHVLSNISFRVASKQTVAILGKSGIGKSTLLSLLGLLDRQDSGELYFSGHCISEKSDRELCIFRNRLIGFVFQSFHLVSHLTVEKNVALPLLEAGHSLAQAKGEAMTQLERVGLADRSTFLPSQLSGGQRQRTAIARALVTRPSVILADEPTGNLDEDSSQHIMQLLFNLNEQSGTTLILITHDQTIAARCERVLTLSAQGLSENVRLSPREV